MVEPPVPHETPIYRRIANQLRTAILNDEYRDGDRLPGENHLMHEYGVARATARQALAVLINEGLAVPRRGSGVYVRTFRPIHRYGTRRLSRTHWGEGKAVWEADVRQRPYSVDVLRVERIRADKETEVVLLTDEVWVRRRRYSVDGRPVQLAATYFPAGLVDGTRVVEPDTGPGGVYARLGELGVAPVRFKEEVRARMPLPDEAALLSLPAGTPVIVVCRTAYAAGDRAVEFNVMTMDAASYVLQYDFDA
ncbi:GntR family transcriptional regulator [Rhizohabitans arisaemae]|uniref:GntR family transcriptional regulator n=1 Tax=Rhizohabitans arisaemae TaxID=2720610 RepID=UPI0024B1C2A1|nr:GntR family transcriptional regulator [Rhizohabitans arisaemae]